MNSNESFFKMNNQLNRYYIKIRTSLEIDPKTIHEELWDPVRHHIQQLQDRQKLFVKEEKMSMIIFDLLSPPSQLTGENIEPVRQVISNDSHSTYDEVIAEASPSYSTRERIIYQCLKMKSCYN